LKIKVLTLIVSTTECKSRNIKFVSVHVTKAYGGRRYSSIL